MDKSELRRYFIFKRKSIDIEQKILYDYKISRGIAALPCFEQAKQVLLFSPTGSEFDASALLKLCAGQSKAVFFPRCLDKDGKMEFLKVTCQNDLESGMYGIKEPKESCEKYIEKPGDVCIVPALSVDSRFYRLGYGKGYYDRFLKNFGGVGICPCYDELLSEELPAGDFDIKVDILVTQSVVRRTYCG